MARRHPCLRLLPDEIFRDRAAAAVAGLLRAGTAAHRNLARPALPARAGPGGLPMADLSPLRARTVVQRGALRHPRPGGWGTAAKNHNGTLFHRRVNLCSSAAGALVVE